LQGYFGKSNVLTKSDFTITNRNPIVKIVADILAILIERAKFDGQIKGMISHLDDGGLSILQYTNDTILFMEHDLEKAQNLKLILTAFKQLSGLKINFYESKLFCFGDAKDAASSYAELWTRPVSNSVFGHSNPFMEIDNCRMKSSRGEA
jgi:hypothetical protein